MHPSDILAAVGRSKYRFLTKIAIETGISHARVKAALYRRQRGGEIAISQCLDIPLHVLWPERWAENGEQILNNGKRRRVIVATTNKKRAA
jgi:Ner family transcriptional regulator